MRLYSIINLKGQMITMNRNLEKNMSHFDINELVEQYSRKVYNLAFRITGSKLDAEDAVQETFIQVYENLDSFRGESAIYTWIYKIALNHCLKMKKKMERAYIASSDEIIESFKDDIPDEVHEWYTDPEKALYINKLLTEIRHGCLHFLSFQLPENQRVVYIMRNILDFSYKEISEVLGISENVVKARLNRARTNLTKFFNGRCQWLTKDNTCTCHSRIGYALALDPELLKRVKAQALEEGIVDENDLDTGYYQIIDDLYKKFPMLEYKYNKLKQNISNIKNS